MPLKDHDAYLAYQREYSKTHPRKPSKDPEAYKTYQKAYRKGWYAKNRAQVLVKTRQYVIENRERVKAKQHEWYMRNQEALITKSMAHSRAHPEIQRAHHKKRRAQKANAPRNDFTHAQWTQVQESQQHRCAYCGKHCKGKLTQDHVLPLSKGGAHTLHNIVGACRSCNAKKQAGPVLKPVQPLLL